ncbi:MAG: MBL fold metallo-hydrolase [Deltaproteobacteria bacterium]|nr:MBL fold metallo-hydrolase [Deltaproteobacteria bacterium]
MIYSIKEELPGLWFIDLKVDGEREYTGAYVIKSGKETALIEVGPVATYKKVLSVLEDIGQPYQDIKYIFVTHIHLDHAGALGNLIKHFPNASIIVHKRGKEHLIDPERTLWKASKRVLGVVADLYGKPESVPENRIMTVEKRMCFDLGEPSLEVIPTPGHASHHVCIFLEKERVIFSGDAAGFYIPSLDVLLPISPPPFKLELAIKSIEAMISAQPQLIAFTHFDVSKNGSQVLRKYYRQLMIWSREIKRIVVKDIRDKGEMLDFISKRDKDLRRFLENSDSFLGIRRGVESGLEGILQLVSEEKHKGQLSL